MRKRMRCLWHPEATASLVQYKDGWRCFGACHRLYTNKEVEDRTGEHYEYEEQDDDKEDLSETFHYIKSLPQRPARGLSFPTDDRGYYIVWPDDAYYKYRLFNPGKGPKYIGPKGHYPPLFWAAQRGSGPLWLVEGEVNAMSVASAFPEDSVASPGSASMFGVDSLSRHLTEFKKYSSIVVVLDDDPAGVKAFIEAKAFLLYKVPFLTFLRVSRDCNEVLCEEGKEGLRKELQRCRGE